VDILQRKSNSYHIEIQTHRRNPYGLLRNSYRENGKVRHETICRFNGLSLEQLRAMQAALQNKTVMKDDFKITQSREYGASFACVALMKELGLHKTIFSRPSEEWVRACLAMIAGRLVYTGSKLSLSQCNTYSALWETCGIESDIDVNVHCYNAMDKLFNRQDAIQKSLAKKHLQNGTVVLYDITSCYMEGEYADSELVDFGYNRDRKRGHEQIVISLLAYYVMWHMKQRLQLLFGSNKNGTRRKYTYDYIMENLKSIRKESVEFCNAKTSIITTSTEEQNLIFKLLAVGF
jgi:hypothetical protein